MWFMTQTRNVKSPVHKIKRVMYHLHSLYKDPISIFILFSGCWQFSTILIIFLMRWVITETTLAHLMNISHYHDPMNVSFHQNHSWRLYQDNLLISGIKTPLLSCSVGNMKDIFCIVFELVIKSIETCKCTALC